jgi:hypothetical protein
VEAVRHQIVAQRHRDAEHDQRGDAVGVGEQHAEHADADRAEADLPFALDAVGDQRTQERPERVGDGDDERVFEARRDLDPPWRSDGLRYAFKGKILGSGSQHERRRVAL